MKPRLPKLGAIFLVAAISLAAAPAGRDNPGDLKLIYESWENTLFQGKKVGFSFMKVERGEEGYRVTGRSVLKLILMKSPQDMSFFSEAFLDPHGALVKFNYLQTMQKQRQSIQGELSDGVITMSITGAGGTSHTKVKVPGNVNLGHIIEYFFMKDLKVGKTITAPVFVEALRAVDNMKLTVTGKKKIRVNRKIDEVFVVESEMQGMKTYTNVTEDGRKVSGSSLMGITFVQTTEKDAVKLSSATVPITSLITFSLITPSRKIETPAKLKGLKVTLEGLSTPEIISDYRQKPGKPKRVLDSKGKRTFSVPVATIASSPTKSLSIKEASLGMEEFLKASPEIQSGNKLIMKTTRQIVGKEKDAWAASKMINQWVFKNLAKEFVDSFTAVDVLLVRKGECQSHTNLFVALARAAGIPSRQAGGLVYSPSNGGFLYHAWPEVFVGEWVALDPTLGQDIADPTHIKLIEGGVESLMSLMRYITKLDIIVEKTDYR